MNVDRAGMDALLREHLPAVRRTIARCLGRGPEADDAVQQTLLTVVRSIGGFRGDAPIGAWIHTIAVRTAWSARARASVIPFSAEVDVPDERRPSGETRADAARALAHLATLTVERRVAFVLHDIEGHTAGEIASMLDVPEGTVNSRLREARLQLRAALTERKEAV